jgi:uncharacterized membrane protein YhaH (DUF805 family)
MNFVQAVQVCLRKYVDFEGRAARPEFWWFALFQVIVLVVAAMLGRAAYTIAGLALVLPSLAWVRAACTTSARAAGTCSST